MKTHCPYCGTLLNMDDIIEDGDWRAILGMIGGFATDGPLVLAYIELFGVVPFSKHRRRILVLLGDIRSLFDSGRFRYRKTDYSISKRGAIEALNMVVRRHFTEKLNNHNYLKKIMIGVSEREEDADRKKAEEDLHKKEQHLKFTPRDDAETEAGLQHISELFRKIGGTT